MKEIDGITMQEFDQIRVILEDRISCIHASIGAIKLIDDEKDPYSTGKEYIKEYEEEISSIQHVIAKIIAKQNRTAMEGLQ